MRLKADRFPLRRGQHLLKVSWRKHIEQAKAFDETRTQGQIHDSCREDIDKQSLSGKEMSRVSTWPFQTSHCQSQQKLDERNESKRSIKTTSMFHIKEGQPA